MIRAFAILLASAAIGFLLVTWQLPDTIMNVLMTRVAATSSAGRLAPPLPDEKARAIVLPSPDLAYVLCSYDLSRGPLTMTFAPPALPYWSVAAYAANTDNFLVIDDRTMPAGGTVLVTPPGWPKSDQASTVRVVESPSERGIVLFRGLMTGRDDSLLKQVQDSVSCQSPNKP